MQVRIRLLVEQRCGDEFTLPVGSEHMATIRPRGMATFSWGAWQVYCNEGEWEQCES